MTQKATGTSLLAVFLLALLSIATAAQTTQPTQAKVNIIIDRETIRFAPQELVQELRLIVTDQSGVELYDSGPLSVSTLDWLMSDNKGEAVKGGLYLYTLTIKDAVGETSQRRGYLIVNRTGDTDRVYVATGDKVGIGAGNQVSQVTVVGNADATVGGAILPSGTPRLEGLSERDTLRRDVGGRGVAEQAEPIQKNSAGGLGPPVKTTNIPDDLVVNGNLSFTPPSPQFTRDITMQNNNGGLRFFGAPTLTTSPAAAAIQFWGNNAPFPGQLYLDSGAQDNAALIFRTAPTGGTIAERMRVTATGNVGIGTTSPEQNLSVNGAMVVDQANGNNGSSINPGMTFGHGSGEGIASKRDAGGNQYGLDFYTAFANRMVITSTGNVGIGTTNPNFAKLQVESEGNNRAVYGNNGFNSGVYGNSDSGSGVVGVSSSGYGVYGSTSGGYAGYFSGKVHVTGVIEKAGGGFKIDHPLDPENKYLIHSFVESPDMKNLYDGTVTTDANGEAEITLPDWFAALNRDFRYQLTCIGVFAQAIIAEEIKDNRFKIRTSLPQVKVSWLVTGIRQDAWANQNRLPVEELKPAVERGFYQNPTAFGQPEEKSIEWARHPEQMRQMKEQREKAQRDKPQKEQQ